MKPSELFGFAGRCLVLDDHPEFMDNIRVKLVSGEVPINDLIWLCSEEYVLPLLYLKLRKHDLLDLFPEEYATHLKEIYELNRTRNLRILEQIEEIRTLLNHEKIQQVYMKGTGNLLDNLYPDVGERMIGDIDFLVSETDYLRTANLILQLGYEDGWRIYDDVSTMKHYPRLFRKDMPADVEVHRIPVDQQYSKQFSSELLFQHKTEVSGVLNSYVPCDEHKIIQNFIHSQLVDLGHRYRVVSLRDLYDLYLLSKRFNPAKVLPWIEEKSKAESYFVLMDHIFNGEFHSSQYETTGSVKLYKKCVWLLDHPQLHRRYIWMIKFYELVFQRYLMRLIKAFFHKSSRKYILNRLREPKFIRMHISGLKDFFS